MLPLATVIDSDIQRKMLGRGAIATRRTSFIKAGKWFTERITNEDVDDIIRITKSLESSGVLIDGVSETLKHEIKKQEGGFFW